MADPQPPADSDGSQLPLGTLGPFEPPADYRFEPEFEPAIPRPIPDELREGRYGRGQRQALVLLVALAVACLAASVVPIVQFWGLFLLPLAYLGWIGAGFAVLAVGVWLRQRFTQGHYRYVESGTPIVTRICWQVLRPAAIINGQTTAYHFAATVQFRDPLSDDFLIMEVTSQDLGAGTHEKVTSTYRVGDYATAVYLDSDLSTLRLYGFLGLRRDLGVVDRNPDHRTSPLKIVAAIGLIFGVLLLFMYGLYAVSRFMPLDWERASIGWTAGIGSIVLGTIGSTAFFYGRGVARRKREERNVAALAAGEPVELADPPRRFGGLGVILGPVVFAGWFLMGAIATLVAAFTANAVLDTSPARQRPVEITEMTMTTHNFVFREYEIKYHFVGEARERDYGSTPAEMDCFAFPVGIANLRDGYFGWEWVESIEPAAPAPGPQP